MDAAQQFDLLHSLMAADDSHVQRSANLHRKIAARFWRWVCDDGPNDVHRRNRVRRLPRGFGKLHANRDRRWDSLRVLRRAIRLLRHVPIRLPHHPHRLHRHLLLHARLTALLHLEGAKGGGDKVAEVLARQNLRGCSGGDGFDYSFGGRVDEEQGNSRRHFQQQRQCER